MIKFVPVEKLSKKAQREINNKKRVTWEINPVTRKPENPKAYSRKKVQRGDDLIHQDAEPFYFCKLSYQD